MKKALLSLVAISSLALNAYELVIENQSNLVLNVDATYGGAGLCSTDNLQMLPKQTRSKGVGACCLHSVIVRAPSIGQTRIVQGALTGAGISCRSNHFVVKYTPGGELAVEQK